MRFWNKVKKVDVKIPIKVEKLKLNDEDLNEKVEAVLKFYDPANPFKRNEEQSPKNSDFSTEFWKDKFRFTKKLKISQYPVDVIMGP